jgi:hypothetical protein
MNTASKLGPAHKRTGGRAPVWGSEFTTKAAKKLELIQTHMAEKPVMRASVYARALSASQNFIRAEVWAATLRGGRRFSAQSFRSGLWPNWPARMAHEVSRTEELAERRRARSVDHAGLEVEEHRACYVPAA